jgi:tripartite-type tricarboxylate transporter receptor subunit TctC
VHFRGTAAAIPDLLANRTPMFFDGIQMLGQHVRAGAIRAMLRTDAQRSPAMPEVPSAHEVGVPDFNVQSWFAIYAPRNTPRPVIDRLAEVNRRVMLAPAMVERYAAEDVKTDPSSPEELAALGQQYFRLFGDAIRANNIRVEA